MKAPLRILIVAALCIAGLIGLVVREGMARDSGTNVLLAMEAIDPRALLLGHYVIVDLREGLEPGEPCPTQNEGAPWVGLGPSGEEVTGAPVFSLVGNGPDPATAATIPGAVAVRGTFTCNPPTPPEGDFEGAPGWVALDLGINRFYASQADAMRIDRILREQRVDETTRVYANVSLGADGRARLQGLVVDGERLELGWN